MRLPLTIDHLLWRMENVHRHAEVVTVVGGAAGVVRRSFPETAARGRALAAGLRKTYGLEPGAVVAVLAFNNGVHLELLLGVPTTGAAIESINVRTGADVIADQLAASSPGVVLIDREALDHPVVGDTVERTHETCVARGVPVLVFDSRSGSGLDAVLATGRAGDLPPAEPAESDVAYLFHTSGTTGRPKTYPVTHRDAVLHALSQATTVAADLRPSDRVMPIAPFFHVNGWGLPLTTAITGSSLVMTGADATPAALLDVLLAERITVAAAVPTVWHDVCAVARERAQAGGDPLPLRQILTGGSPVPASIVAEVERWLGAPLVNAWGMTETMACSTYERLDPAAAAGFPVPLVEMRIAEAMADQGDTRRGPLEVRGAFVVGADPEDPAGWLDTGDIASVDGEGRVRLHDRTKDLIKSGGEWIVSTELELRLCTHPSVSNAAVVARPDERWMERPVAYVTPAVGRRTDQVDLAELRAHLAEVFPKWWLPDQITVIEDLPRTAVGKIDKVSLRRAQADGVLHEQHVPNNEKRNEKSEVLT